MTLARRRAEHGIKIGLDVNSLEIGRIDQRCGSAHKVQVRSVIKGVEHTSQTLGSFHVSLTGKVVEHVIMGIEGGIHVPNLTRVTVKSILTL